ncbi:MAG: hypothetical protein MSK40_05055 [Parabacteroides sp.]|jgi:hypothetical protein|nr:hypothetical protein [Parabacteroides sp.]
MKQFLCIFISITTLFMGMGCDDKEENPVPGNDTIDVSIHAFLQDTEGNDLFNPETMGYINPDSIWIEPGAGTDLTPYFPLQEIPNGSSFGETEQGFKHLGLTLSFHTDDNYTLDYIHWSDDWVDTVRCGLRHPAILTDIYINGKLVMPDETLTEQVGRAVIFVRPEKE